MKRKRNTKNGGVDRISELPECIIHGIMSHLSSKEVARTCLLSKTWYRLKKNYPVLDFELPMNSDCFIKLKPVVYDFLQHFSSNKLLLQTFSLKNLTLGQPKVSSDLDFWIRLALENGAKELILFPRKFRNCHVVPEPVRLYTLPPQVFSSKTLTTLDLTYCVLDMPISTFSSLRKLVLSECILNGSISLKDIDCPLLEEMSVRLCGGENFNSIHIPSLLRLHTVVASASNDSAYNKLFPVEILSQSISSLALISDYLRPWSNINIYGCYRLKSLYLKTVKITDAELHSLLLNFPVLEELYLFSCCSLKKIKISSPQLKTLEICYELSEHKCILIEVSAPNLENLVYKSVSCGSSLRKSYIEVADCCRSLKTLVLYVRVSAEEVFHNLISRFPLLENIWIIRCKSLRNIKVPNLQLKRLYIVRCSKLKDVEVSSPNLCEFYCSNRTLPISSVDDDVCASGVKCRRSSIKFCLSRLKKILKSLVHIKGESILDEVVNVGV